MDKESREQTSKPLFSAKICNTSMDAAALFIFFIHIYFLVTRLKFQEYPERRKGAFSEIGEFIYLLFFMSGHTSEGCALNGTG